MYGENGVDVYLCFVRDYVVKYQSQNILSVVNKLNASTELRRQNCVDSVYRENGFDVYLCFDSVQCCEGWVEEPTPKDSPCALT